MPTNAHSLNPCAFGRVQVQIVTYNSQDYIDRCIQSVLRQTYPSVSLLIIDNASQDRTLSRLAAYPSIKLHAFETNIGYAAAHNFGFAKAVEDDIAFVLTLNPDIELDPIYLERTLTIMTDKAIGGVTGKLLRNRNKSETAVDCLLDSTGLVMGLLYHARDRGSGQVDMSQYDRLTNVWGICGAAAVYRIAMLKDLAPAGGQALEELFFVYKEDVDLCWQANRLGWRFAYESKALAYHERGWKDGRTPVSWRAKEHSLANQVAILIRHGRIFSPILWISIIAECVRISALALQRPSSAQKTLHLIMSQFRHHVHFRHFIRKRIRSRKE